MRIYVNETENFVEKFNGNTRQVQVAFPGGKTIVYVQEAGSDKFVDRYNGTPKEIQLAELEGSKVFLQVSKDQQNPNYETVYEKKEAYNIRIVIDDSKRLIQVKKDKQNPTFETVYDNKEAYNIRIEIGEGPPPLGWTSIGRWDKDGSRTVSTHMGFDPKDPTVALASGGNNRKLVIDGQGKAILSGDTGRIYIFENNYDSVLELKYIPKEGLKDLSLKQMSRHQEEPLSDKEIRFGGYGVSFNMNKPGNEDSNQVGCKREDYHPEENEHSHEDLGSKALEKPLEYDKTYGVRCTCKNINGTVNLVAELDYNDGNGYVKVAEFTDKNPKPHMIDRKMYFDKKGRWPTSSYVWIRINGDDSVKDIPIWDVSVKPLE